MPKKFSSNGGSSDPILMGDSKRPKSFMLSPKNPWNTILGDCSVVDEYLMDKDPKSLKWAPMHFVNVFLRAVGQVSG